MLYSLLAAALILASCSSEEIDKTATIVGTEDSEKNIQVTPEAQAELSSTPEEAPPPDRYIYLQVRSNCGPLCNQYLSLGDPRDRVDTTQIREITLTTDITKAIPWLLVIDGDDVKFEASPMTINGVKKKTYLSYLNTLDNDGNPKSYLHQYLVDPTKIEGLRAKYYLGNERKDLDQNSRMHLVSEDAPVISWKKQEAAKADEFSLTNNVPGSSNYLRKLGVITGSSGDDLPRLTLQENTWALVDVPDVTLTKLKACHDANGWWNSGTCYHGECPKGHIIQSYDRSGPVCKDGATKHIRALGVGKRHSCAVYYDQGGALKCWGHGTYGQVARDSLSSSVAPTPGYNWGVADRLDIFAIAAGTTHTCAISTDTLYCWGQQRYLAINNPTTPTAAGTNSITASDDAGGLSGPFFAIETNLNRENSVIDRGTTCLIHGPDRRVSCWGHNKYCTAGLGPKGQNVNSNCTNDYAFIPNPINITSSKILNNVSEISVGEVHACALRFDGAVYCWGADHQGFDILGSFEGEKNDDALNNAEHSQTHYATEFTGFSLPPYLGLAANVWNTCLTDANGNTFCFGDDIDYANGDNQDHYYQSGIPNENGTPLKLVKIDEQSNLKASKLYSSYYRFCARDLTDAHSFLCWGFTAYRSINRSTDDQKRASVFARAPEVSLDASPIYQVMDVDAGGYHSCYSVRPSSASLDETLYCQGHNPQQQIGAGGVGNSNGANRYQPFDNLN